VEVILKSERAPREEEERTEAGHDARPGGRAGEGDLRLVAASLLPAVVQGGSPGRGWRETAPGAGMFVRKELAGHVEFGRADLEPVRHERRGERRGLAPCGVASLA
jgi:hypothetical protein